MDRKRTPTLIATAVLSLGLMAACSDEPDRNAAVPAETVTPAPVAPPAANTAPTAPPSTDTVPQTVPDASPVVPPPVESTVPPAGTGETGNGSSTPGS